MKFWLLPFILLLCGCSIIRVPTTRTQFDFPKRIAAPSITPFQFKTTIDSSLHTRRWTIDSFKGKTLTEIAESSNSSAILLSRNDSIIYQWYDSDISPDSTLATFSLAKSFTSALVGVAIEEGLIANIDEPVANYFPNLPNGSKDTLRISHLLEMTSGYAATELKILFSEDHLSTLKDLRIISEPGERFRYYSASTQVLGEILAMAIAPRSITEYVEEKIWKPAGMSSPLTWRLDREEGTEKAFCCMELSPQDLLRFGYLYLNNGYMNGQQLIPEAWVQKSTQAHNATRSNQWYGYLFWIPTKSPDVFMARGFRGQYLVVNRKTNMMAVRMGESRRRLGRYGWDKYLVELLSKS